MKIYRTYQYPRGVNRGGVPSLRNLLHDQQIKLGT